MRNYQHISFCCSANCARKRMRNLIEGLGFEGKISMSEFTVEIPGYKWSFVFTADNEPERIYGRIIDSFDTCEKARVHPKAIEYIKSHLGREKR